MSANASIAEGFARSASGLRIHFCRHGTVGPALVCAGGLGVSIEFWRPFAERMAARGCRVVRFSYRGHGRSELPAEPGTVTMEDLAADLVGVVDSLGLERPVLLGFSLGSQVILESYRRLRERVAALVPTLGVHRRGLDGLNSMKPVEVGLTALRLIGPRLPWLVGQVARPLLLSGVIEVLARQFRFIDPELAPHDAIADFMAHYAQLDPRLCLALAEAMQSHDASDLLPEISVPVLAISGGRDLFAPRELVREMVDLIPGAELLHAPRCSHAALVEAPDLLARGVEDFLQRRVFPAQLGVRQAG